MNVLSCFDGMSCGQIALERAGFKVENYFASEIDKYAIQITQKNYPNTIQLGTIENWREWELPKIDLIMGGSPCTGLSVAGLGQGFDDPRSKLFSYFPEIVGENNKAKFLFENVKMKPEWQDIISDNLGVEPIEINSDRFVPQNRPRLYWTNIPVDPLPERPDWDGQYYQWRRTYFRENKSGVCPCLTANMGTGGHNIPLKSMNLKDRLTPEECEKLQGIPIGYTEGISNSRRYQMIGNGWTVEVIAHILKNMEDAHGLVSCI